MAQRDVYDYTISRENNPEIFKEACRRIKASHPEFSVCPLLTDVDGTTIQLFKGDEAEIKVYDDYDVGAVYVISDIRLDTLFGWNR